MIRSFSFVLIAAVTVPVLANMTANMIQSTLRRGPSGFINISRRACFASHMPYKIRTSENISKHDTGGRFRQSSLNPTSFRSTNFHSSTMLMMGSKRKKNGGKSKQVKVVSTSKTAAKKSAFHSSLEESRQEVDNTELTITELFDNEIYTGANEETDSVLTEFASEYHAPVMPTECVQALLQQGMWAELLEAKKNRWRKKKSIIDAKKRRLGQVDDDVTDDLDNNRIATHELSCDVSDNMKPRLFIDGTLGGGGHSQAILQQLNQGDILIGCDVDPEALSTASNRLINYLGTREYILDRHDDGMECRWDESSPMFIPVQSNFRNLRSVLSKVRHPKTKNLLLGHRDNTKENEKTEFPLGANGLLLDLGVSSHQIDTPDRGFAFMKEGPLDMRMSGNSLISSRTNSSLTAADICNEFDEPSIISILQTFGDEPRARRIASAIVAARPLFSTTDLVHAINSVTPTFARQKRAGLIATSARVFQALRIAVNEEDGALRDVLEKVAPWVLSGSGGMMKAGNIDSGGVLVVLSYHSMEDKMTKRVLRDGSVNFLDRHRGRGGALERDIFGNTIGLNGDASSTEEGNQLPFEPLGKPQKAKEEEISLNSRARSATLRVGIRN